MGERGEEVEGVVLRLGEEGLQAGEGCCACHEEEVTTEDSVGTGMEQRWPGRA